MMRAPRSRRAFLPLGLSLVLALSCSDARDAGMIAGPSRVARLTQSEVGPAIDAHIAATLTGGTRAAVSARWESVKRQGVGKVSGRQQFAQLADFVMRKASEFAGATPTARSNAATKLVMLMSAYLYGIPAEGLPDIGPATDATVEIVQPSETDTVITPAIRAAAIFPAGAVSEPTVVVIAKVDQAYTQCAGPLPTTRCQYPDFYKFTAFPDQKFGVKVTVAVCLAQPETPGHHDFRLAHEAPPVDRQVPGGTVEGGIELLPYKATPGLICPEKGGQPLPEVPISTHGARSTLHRAGSALASAARTTIGLFLPRPLYARRIDRGGGGELYDFSNVVHVGPPPPIFVD